MCSLESAARDGVDLAHDQALIDLRRAPPLSQAAALVRLVELQASLITDLRNRVRHLEARQLPPSRGAQKKPPGRALGSGS